MSDTVIFQHKSKPNATNLKRSTSIRASEIKFKVKDGKTDYHSSLDAQELKYKKSTTIFNA